MDTNRDGPQCYQGTNLCPRDFVGRKTRACLAFHTHFVSPEKREGKRLFCSQAIINKQIFQQNWSLKGAPDVLCHLRLVS